MNQSRKTRKVRGLSSELRKITSGFSHIRIVFQTCPPLLPLLLCVLDRETSPSFSSFSRLPSRLTSSFTTRHSAGRFVVVHPLRRSRTRARTPYLHCVSLPYNFLRRGGSPLFLSPSSTCFSSFSLPLPFSISFLFWFCNPFYETSVARTR